MTSNATRETISTMKAKEKPDAWLTSKHVERELHVESCELMHLRLRGRLRFHKKGNAFMYPMADVLKLKRIRATP